jgi:hypothetical protein
VTVTIVGALAVQDSIDAVTDTTGEFGMGTSKSGVDDVGVDSRPPVVVGEVAISRPIALIDSAQAPGGTVLGGRDPHLGVLDDVVDPRIACQRFGRSCRHADREPLQRVGKLMAFLAAVPAEQVVGGTLDHVCGHAAGHHGLQHNDVLIRYRAAGVRPNFTGRDGAGSRGTLCVSGHHHQRRQRCCDESDSGVVAAILPSGPHPFAPLFTQQRIDLASSVAAISSCLALAGYESENEDESPGDVVAKRTKRPPGAGPPGGWYRSITVEEGERVPYA